MFRPEDGNIHWLKQELAVKNKYCATSWNLSLCVCISLLSIMSLQNIFHSNQHTHNYLNESNAKDVIRTCRTCDGFNIVGKCKPQMQCNKSDPMSKDIE